jgi:hypothetical protein
MRSLHYVTASKAIALGGPVPAYSCKLALSERWIVVTSDKESQRDFFSERHKFESVSKARFDAYRRNLPKWKDTVFPSGESVPPSLLEIRTSTETSPRPEQT